MKKALLTGVAALFVTSCQAPLRTAHAADICYEVQKTPDKFVALREHATTKSKVVWVLREGDTFVAYDGGLDEEDYYWKKNWKRWVQVKTRYYDPIDNHTGWVYKKYIKEVSCEEEAHGEVRGTIPGLGVPDVPTIGNPNPEPHCYPKWTGLKRC